LSSCFGRKASKRVAGAAEKLDNKPETTGISGWKADIGDEISFTGLDFAGLSQVE
jgi:hypothetical protein